MTTQEGPQPDRTGKDRVDNPTAWEAAHAEVPFRDALKKYAGDLSPEERGRLLWIASKEAENAIEKFSQQQGGDRERAKEIIKKRVMEAITSFIPPWLKVYMKPEILDSKIFLRQTLRDIAEPQIDEVLNSKLSPEAKTKRLKDIQESIYAGMVLAENQNVADIIIRDHTIKDRKPEEQTIDDSGLNMLRLSAVLLLLINSPDLAMRNLEMIAAHGPKKGRAGYKDMLPIIERWQVTPGADLIISTTGSNPREQINRHLEEIGLVWDPEQKKYLEIQ